MTFKEYVKSSIKERKRYLETQFLLIPKQFELIKHIDDKTIFPTFRLADTSIEFVLVIGDSLTVGLGEKELENILKISSTPNITIDEMRPIYTKEVNNFLVMKRPYLNSDKKADNDWLPFFCDIDIAEKICVDHLCRLPYEIEWEYFCRAGKQNIFSFGNSIPEDKILEKWLEWDYSNKNNIAYNDFGISGLYFGEWCKDFYKPNHLEKSDYNEDARVIKGGGAYFWPWQDEEWVWCLTAMRMPSTDLIDNNASFRMVYEIPASARVSRVSR